MQRDNRSRNFRLLGLLGLVAAIAAGQSGDGYLSVGAGSDPAGAITEPAGGGELVLGNAVGLGGAIGAVLRQHGSYGFVSADVSYHLARNVSSGRFDPFIEGGYTRAFHLFSGDNGGNFGVGLNYWFARHFGIRGQFRQLLLSGGAGRPWAFCAGIALR